MFQDIYINGGIIQVKPTKYLSKWTNLLHLTLGGDVEAYGDRTPAIFFHRKQGMMVASAVSGEKNFRPKPSGGETKFWKLPNLREWTWVAIGQRQEERTNAVSFYISINDEEVFSVLNTQPRNFSDVKVFYLQNFAQHIVTTFIRCMFPTHGMRRSLQGSGHSLLNRRVQVTIFSMLLF